MFAVLQVVTFRTICHLPHRGAVADETFLWASPSLAAQAFGVVEKPLKTFTKFREIKTFVSWKTVSPPVDR